MADYKYIGGDFDLPAKKILLDIVDDDQFVAACSANSAMRQICAGEDIWRERLKRYYPNTDEYRQVLGLTWKEYYALISLWTQYAKVDASNSNTSILPRLIKYLSQLNIDYQLLFKNAFTDLFVYTNNKSVYLRVILKTLSGFFLDNNQLDKFRSMKWRVNMTKYGDLTISRDLFYKILKLYGSGTTIAQIILSSNLRWITFYGSEGKMSEKKTDELFSILLPKLKQELDDDEDDDDDNDDYDDSNAEYKSRIKELIPLTIRKYNTQMTDKLIRENPDIDVSEVLTEYIMSNVQSTEQGSYSNCIEIIVYMTSRRIYPKFDILLPTRTFLESEFFDILVSDVNEDEIDEENIPDTELGQKIAQYKYLIEFKSITEIIELFSVANMYPSIQVKLDIPKEILDTINISDIIFV